MHSIVRCLVVTQFVRHCQTPVNSLEMSYKLIFIRQAKYTKTIEAKFIKNLLSVYSSLFSHFKDSVNSTSFPLMNVTNTARYRILCP